MQAYGQETGQSDSELVRDAIGFAKLRRISLLITGKEPEPARLEHRMKRLRKAASNPVISSALRGQRLRISGRAMTDSDSQNITKGEVVSPETLPG